MSPASEIIPASATQPNSLAAIQKRVAAGQIPWMGPLLLLPARSLMWMATQGILALVFLAQHRPDPWRQATYWWSILGTLGDIVCLIGLRYFTRREGIRIRDLLGPIRMHRGRDLFLGLSIFLLYCLAFMGGGYLSQRLFYGSSGATPGLYLFHSHALPLWAMVYSFTLWWFISSAVEEATYQGYALPRVEALTSRTWAAVAIVGFCYTAQHLVFGFEPSWRFVACRFVGFLPGCLLGVLIYVRTRRLMPLIFAHWPIDIMAVLMNAF